MNKSQLYCKHTSAIYNIVFIIMYKIVCLKTMNNTRLFHTYTHLVFMMFFSRNIVKYNELTILWNISFKIKLSTNNTENDKLKENDYSKLLNIQLGMRAFEKLATTLASPLPRKFIHSLFSYTQLLREKKNIVYFSFDILIFLET